MKAKGRIALPILDFFSCSETEVAPFLKRWLTEKKKLSFTITGEAFLETTENPRLLLLSGGDGGCDLMLETWYQKRSLTQLNTLKALESLIYQIDYQRKPKSSDLDFIHQGILEMANIKIENPWTKHVSLVRTSMAECTTSHMNRFIEVALEELSLRDLEDDIRDAMFDRPISEIFKTWYKKRIVENDLDDISWNEYRKRIPYCEFTFKPSVEGNPLERMHIISAGKDKMLYEKPWNWIHAQRHIHQKQHQYGWDAIMQDYPHIVPKIKRARERASEQS